MHSNSSYTVWGIKKSIGIVGKVILRDFVVVVVGVVVVVVVVLDAELLSKFPQN